MDDQLSSTSRLEAFSDGVIAVIITIMVLELKVPAQRGFPGLLSILPTLAVYFISFSFTAIYWINHHHLVDRIEQCDQRVLYANLGFLFCLAAAVLYVVCAGEGKRLLFDRAVCRVDGGDRVQLSAATAGYRAQNARGWHLSPAGRCHSTQTSA